FAKRGTTPFSGYGRDERLNVTEGVGECLKTSRIAGNRGDMVRHHHPVVVHFAVHAQCSQHIDVAIVDERLTEVEKPSANVSKVDVEDLLADSEIPNHVEDLLAWRAEHLGDRALTEIQAVVRTRVDFDEAFE